MAWNRPSNDGRARTPAAPRRTRSVRPTVAVIVGLIVVGAAVAAWWLLSDSTPPPSTSTSTSTSLIREAKPAAAPKAEPVEPKEELPMDPGSVAARARKAAFMERIRKSPKNMYALTNQEWRSAKVVFNTGVDQVFDRIFNCTPGDMPPIPPIGIEPNERKRLAEILIEKSEPAEDDGEETVLRRDNVNYAKSEMRKFIKEGGSPEEFLDYYYNELRRAHDRHYDASEAVYDTIRNESPEVAREMYLKVNEMLQKDGIKGIELTDSQRALLNLKEDE